MLTMVLGQSSRAAPLTGRLWLSYGPLLAFWAVYYASVWIALAPFGKFPSVIPTDILAPFLLGTAYFVVFSALVFLAGILFLKTDESRLVRVRRLLTETPWIEIATLRLLPGFLYIYSVLGIFRIFKPHIPEIIPFTWDATFVAWDRVLFLGWDGWQVTHALISADWVTYLIDIVYIAWLYIVLAVFLAAICAPLDSRRRLACLLSYGLNWAIAGSLLAVLFSSAGPIFLDRMFGDPTFLDMEAKLRALDQAHWLWAVYTSDLLWDGYTKADGVPEFGISAFPSLHVCMAATVWYYARSCGPIRGLLGLAFFLTILIGSVHLGWHYLVDGLASWLIAWINWRLALRFAGWWLGRQA